MRYVFVEEKMFWSIREVYDRVAPEWYQPRILEPELAAGFARFKSLLKDLPNGPLDWETADHAPCRVLYAYLPDREPRFVEAMIAIAGLLEELGPKWVFEAEVEDDSGVYLFLCKGLLHFRDTKAARKFVKAVCAPKIQEQALALGKGLLQFGDAKRARKFAEEACPPKMQEQQSIDRSDYPMVSEYDGLVRPKRYERLVKAELSWVTELGFEPGVMYGTKHKLRPAYDLGFRLRLVDSEGSSCVCAYGVELGFNDHGSQGARLFWMTDHLKPMLKKLASLGFSSHPLKRPDSIYKRGLLSRGLTAFLVRGQALEFCLWGYGHPDEVYDRKVERLRGIDDGIWALDEARIDEDLSEDPGILFGEVRIASPQAPLVESDLVKLGFELIGESRAGLSRWLCDGRIVVELRSDVTTDLVVPVFVAASLRDPGKLGVALQAKPVADPTERSAHELTFEWDFGNALVRTKESVELIRRQR